MFSCVVTFGVKDDTTEAPPLQPPITRNAEQQFDGAGFNRSGFKDPPGEDRDGASLRVIGSAATPTREVRCNARVSNTPTVDQL